MEERVLSITPRKWLKTKQNLKNWLQESIRNSRDYLRNYPVFTKKWVLSASNQPYTVSFHAFAAMITVRTIVIHLSSELGKSANPHMRTNEKMRTCGLW